MNQLTVSSLFVMFYLIPLQRNNEFSDLQQIYHTTSQSTFRLSKSDFIFTVYSSIRAVSKQAKIVLVLASSVMMTLTEAPDSAVCPPAFKTV